MAKTLVSYTLPQTLVHQQISQQVRNTIADLQSVIVGPQFDLKRYDVEEEKKQIGVVEETLSEHHTAHGRRNFF